MTSYPQGSIQHASVLIKRAVSKANSTLSTDQHGSVSCIRAAFDLQKCANSTDSTLFTKTRALRARDEMASGVTLVPTSNRSQLTTVTTRTLPCYPCCVRHTQIVIHNLGGVR